MRTRSLDLFLQSKSYPLDLYKFSFLQIYEPMSYTWKARMILIGRSWKYHPQHCKVCCFSKFDQVDEFWGDRPDGMIGFQLQGFDGHRCLCHMLQSLKDPVISRNWNWTYWVIISHSLWLLQIWRWLATWWLAQSILLEKPSPAEFQWSTMLQRQRYYETWLLGTMLILDIFGKTVTWCQVCDLNRSPGSRLGFCKPSLLLHRVWQQGEEDQWQM